MEFLLTGSKKLKKLSSGSLAPFLRLLILELASEGYADETIRAQLRLVGDLARWLKRKRLTLEALTRDHICHYIRYRTKRHKWSKRQGMKRALERFMKILKRDTDLKSRSRTMTSPVERVTHEYAVYLKQERNLADSTVTRYRGVVKCFLSDLFGRGRVKLASLKPTDVIGFVQKHANRHPRESKNIRSALRSFLRYLRYRNFLKADLVGAVPIVAQWSMAGLPRSISTEQIDAVLAGCDRGTATGRRDYAIILLLARLGVRACEARSLKLEDIDWETGRITVRGKNGRVQQLPLVKDVGEAIVEYLRSGRPKSSSRFVFLRTRAPVGPLVAPSAVTSIVDRALARCGVNTPHRGAHQFRHGLASEMLRKGASLAEIGELLGHRRPDTTAIYAKVDILALHTLALPWPGGVR